MLYGVRFSAYGELHLKGLNAVHSFDGPARPLPQRLRALREQSWPHKVITQAQLAEAFSVEKSTSVPLISSWENPNGRKQPPPTRLEAYARFFATERSVESEDAYRLLPLEELNADERPRYDELLEELTELRSGVTATPADDLGLWHFPDGYDILVVCAKLPDYLVHKMGAYTDPDAPDYVDLYTYADPDALVELFGHLRAVNPDSDVRFATPKALVSDDYSKHLVLLGGVDWNTVTRELLDRVDLPVRQTTRPDIGEHGGFEVVEGDRTRFFQPVIHDGPAGPRLVEDVAHFYRRANPFNRTRTVTICNGMYGRGTFGAVRALTDAKFRARNDAYAREHLARDSTFSLLMRVQVIEGKVVTPDWTVAYNRLHQLPEAVE